MKIAIPAFVLDGGKSGIATYLCALVNHMPRTHEVHLFVPKGQEEAFIHCSCALHVVHEKIQNPFGYFLWNNLVFKHIEKDYDLVHYPCHRRLPLFSSRPTIATVHDIGPYFSKEKYGTLRHWYHKYLLPTRLQACNHIIAVSKSTKRDLNTHLSIPNDKISVVYSGVDRNIFRPLGQGKKEPYFIYVSRIEYPNKNHVGLITAFEIFKNRNPQSRHKLIIAGADWNGADIVKKRAQESIYRTDIQFLGFVPKEKIVELYSNADLMIFPSLFEGFGLPVLEALSCGTKVIVSNTTSLKELAEMGKLISFNPHNPMEIAYAIEAGLQEKKRDFEPFLEHFDWNNTAKEVISIYERTCSQ
jgi:glycosyltransferase involved in cell wall biosynthesis